MPHFLKESKKIYIPIWFYFNDSVARHIENTWKFTFQYGSTLITKLRIEEWVSE